MPASRTAYRFRHSRVRRIIASGKFDLMLVTARQYLSRLQRREAAAASRFSWKACLAASHRAVPPGTGTPHWFSAAVTGAFCVPEWRTRRRSRARMGEPIASRRRLPGATGSGSCLGTPAGSLSASSLD